LLPPQLSGIAYGGDYSPEQWPVEVQEADIALMLEAGVTLVTVGIHTWALMEPAEGTYDFDWLDEIIDRLHAAGIQVDLATPSVAPPAWFSYAYPSALPVTRSGQRLGYGARQSICPSSPDYRRAAAALVERLGARYAGHPAVVLWHVYNEYGAPQSECYCDTSRAAFHTWLRARYGTLGALNQAWGTSFWGQQYGAWEHIDVPREGPTAVNPAQRLDFARFTNDELLACYRNERDILHRLDPGTPVTTNFAGTINGKATDLWTWAPELDVVANDNYLTAERADNHIELAMSADLARGVAGGGPWLLMEHSTGAVNWQPRNIAKLPGQMRRNSLAHVAHGSDSVLFFQWRASLFGAEKFHSAMLPHAGTDSAIWREVVRLGTDLRGLAEVAGSLVRTRVAVIWSWPSWWALELDWRPSADLSYRRQLDLYYEALWREHVTVDFVAPGADLSQYSLVVAAHTYLLSAEEAGNLAEFAASGGHLLVSYFSGIADEHDALHPGGYPGALREVLGIGVEEFHPLRAGETIMLTGGHTGQVWSEPVRSAGAEPYWTYLDGPDAGHPAVTRHAYGDGVAWYVSTELTVAGLRELLADVLAGAGITRPGFPDTVELVRRHAPECSYLFIINHGEEAVTVPVDGVDLLDGTRREKEIKVAGGATAVVREPA